MDLIGFSVANQTKTTMGILQDMHKDLERHQDAKLCWAARKCRDQVNEILWSDPLMPEKALEWNQRIFRILTLWMNGV